MYSHSDIDSKVCNLCHQGKPKNEFGYRKDDDRYNLYCKQCENIKRKTSAAKNKLNPTEIKCSTCEITKKVAEFNKTVRNKTGYQSSCRECGSAHKKTKYWSNHEDELKKFSASRLKPENIAQRKEYYILNREKYKERYLEYRADEQKRENKKRVNKEHYLKAKAQITVREKARRQTGEWKDAQKQRHKIRKETDPIYNLKRRLRFRVRSFITRYTIKMEQSALDIIGCSIDTLKKHIASKFKEGMSWDEFNKGNIHIDHMKPLSSFDFLQPEQIKLAFHYSNLQPLWAIDNLRKGAKLNYELQVA